MRFLPSGNAVAPANMLLLPNWCPGPLAARRPGRAVQADPLPEQDARRGRIGIRRRVRRRSRPRRPALPAGNPRRRSQPARLPSGWGPARGWPAIGPVIGRLSPGWRLC